MPNNNYNPNFLETPDPVTGLQRRVGQNFLDHKQTLHERLVLEHNLDPGEQTPQNDHGIHRQGSAVAYYIESGAPLPSERPTGQSKAGGDKGENLIPAKLLSDVDAGRIAIRGGSEMHFWDGTQWVVIDTTPVGFISIWPAPSETPNTEVWKKCDGTEYAIDDYPDLWNIIGAAYGGDGTNTFKVPNLQGVTVMGSGTLNFPTDGIPDNTLTGRNKGGGTIGRYLEDQIQDITGTAEGNGVYAEGGLFQEFSGVLEHFNADNDRNHPLDRVTSAEDPTFGFQINLDAGGVRNGTETRGTALVMDYYIKAK